MLQLGHVYDRVDPQEPDGKYGEWVCRRCGARTFSTGPDDSLRNYAWLTVNGSRYEEIGDDFSDRNDARTVDGTRLPRGRSA